MKHYDDNLAELKGNIERVEKAKDKKQAEAEIEKTLAHLEKVKAPSRHQKLDPNDLPFRQPKVIKREPRMKKEEFERDLKKDKNAWRYEISALLAVAGIAAGASLGFVVVSFAFLVLSLVLSNMVSGWGPWLGKLRQRYD